MRPTAQPARRAPTWQWVAEALVAAGHEVAVPDLRDAAVTGYPDAVIAAAAAVIPPG